jgi:hypothetical protein
MEAKFFAAIPTQGYKRERMFFPKEPSPDLALLKPASKILVHDLRKIPLDDFRDFPLIE